MMHKLLAGALDCRVLVSGILMCLHLVLSFLNYVVPKAIVSLSAYGRGKGPILLPYLLCNGDEDSLTSCPYSGFGEHTCSARNIFGVSNIAGVVCSNGTFKISIVCMQGCASHYLSSV